MQHTPELRLKIVCFYDQKMTQAKMVEQIGLSKSTVSRTLSKYKKTKQVVHLKENGRTKTFLKDDINITLALDKKNIKLL